MDGRNARKRERRDAKRLSGKTTDMIREDLIHNMMNSVMCHVKQKAKARVRRKRYCADHKQEEAARSKVRNDAARETRWSAPAATNERGIYIRVVDVADAAISHAKAMANDRIRNKKNNRENRPRINKRKRERLKNDKQYAVTCRLRSRLANFVRDKGYKKNSTTMKLIGKSYSETTRHLNMQLRGDESILDMEIDHIFPMSMYNLKHLKEQKRCMNFSNLQPLSHKENFDKLDKLPTKAMASKVEAWAWPPGVTEDMLPDIYDCWATPLRM